MEYTKAYSQYGASMGRASYEDHASDETLKFRLALVPLNNGGYDPGGAYWGHGMPLYVAECSTDDGNGIRDTRKFYRAQSREQAKELVRKDYPNARFYR